MNTRALNELAEVVRRAQAEGRRTPMGVAMAVESAVVEPLRARVAELEAERHTTNEALSDAAEALRAQQDRITELEALKPAAIQTCRACGAGYTYGQPCSTCKFRKRMASEGEFHDVLHHSYDTPHDLPAPGDRQ